MVKWEYRTARVYSDAGTEGLLREAEAALNDEGEDGWELVNIVINHFTRMTTRQGQPVAIEERELLLFLKRPF
jgi:hypothetical protein